MSCVPSATSAPLGQTTVSQALAGARALGLDRLDAQLLLLHALARPPVDRAWLLAHDSDELDDAAAARFRGFSLRRAAGEPLAYLVGSKEFFGLTFAVDARVLVPRPDTETLVQWALDVLHASTHSHPAVLDLGTGSGAVAIAIAVCSARSTPHASARVMAIDVSLEALAVATHNAGQLGARVQFAQSHWLDQVAGQFQVIVSNPPYVATHDPHLPALRHEPLSALTAGPDGLADLRLIIEQAPRHLAAGGWLLLEHGHDQSAAVCRLLRERGFASVQSRPDLAGRARCSGGLWLPADTSG